MRPVPRPRIHTMLLLNILSSLSIVFFTLQNLITELFIIQYNPEVIPF